MSDDKEELKEDKGARRWHHGVVIYRRRLRDNLRKTYWVRCVKCDLNRGPFPRGLAELARVSHDFGDGEQQ